MKDTAFAESKVSKLHLYTDFQDFPEITDEIRKSNADRIFTGSVRINCGMYRTDSEKNSYIENSLKRKLP